MRLKPEVRREIAGLIWVAAGALGVAAMRGGGAAALVALRALLQAAFGQLGLVPPLLALGTGLALIFPVPHEGLDGRAAGFLLATVATDAWLHLRIPAGQAFAQGWDGHGGGLVGAAVSWPLRDLLGATGTRIVLVLGLLVALVLVLQRPVGPLVLAALRGFGRAAAAGGRWLANFVYPQEAARPDGVQPPAALPAAAEVASAADPSPVIDVTPDRIRRTEPEPEREPEPEPAPAPPPRAPRAAEAQAPAQLTLTDAGLFQLPPLDLLRRRPAKGRGQVQRDATARGRALEEALGSFGVQTKVVEVTQGPTVTRFEVQPGEGVRVNRISALADDIALALASGDVRIVAPIPGKSVVGIEVPNGEVTPVLLRDVMESPDFRRSASPLTVALGEDITGRPVVSTLDKMVHVLIGGATGSGKSITLNAMLSSLLFKARPDELRLVLIDPKMVELSVYNGIPHLMAPVVTDPKKAAATLRKLIVEMEARYNRFTEAGARHIGAYNQWAADQEAERLPFIVVVIDELADLMLVARADVENSIQRLCQMARAAGIHLVVATQRPSVDVITGVIKANIQTRIALSVSSQVDSRTILDVAGAEKLLGRGDMLFHPVGAGKPVRAQGAFISDAELEAILDFLRDQGQPDFHPEIASAEGEGGGGAGEQAGDALFASAVRVVAESGQASVSMLQRRLRVGFTRAGRLIDMMEERGLVGPHQGSKSREVLITLEGYRRMFGGEDGADAETGPPRP